MYRPVPVAMAEMMMLAYRLCNNMKSLFQLRSEKTFDRYLVLRFIEQGFTFHIRDSFDGQFFVQKW